MKIMLALKQFLATEEAKYQAFLFALETRQSIKAPEEIQAELDRKLQAHPKTAAQEAYISALEKMLTWGEIDLAQEIALERYTRAGRIHALETIIAQFGNLEELEHELNKASSYLYTLAEAQGENTSGYLANKGHLEALLEAKNLIEEILSQPPITKN